MMTFAYVKEPRKLKFVIPLLRFRTTTKINITAQKERTPATTIKAFIKLVNGF